MCSLKFVYIIFFIILMDLCCATLSAQIGTSQDAATSVMDSDTVWKLNLSDYVHRVDSIPATITGGCVSLTSGTMATSFLLMALDISGKKEANNIRKKKINNLIIRIREKRDSLGQSADYDNRIFHLFLTAYKLPHGAPAEKLRRDSIIHAALLEATNSPLRAAQLIERILLLCEKSVNLSADNVFSDFKASTILLNASFEAIIFIANDNIRQLNPLESAAFKKRRDTIIKNEKSTFHNIMAVNL